MKLLKKAIVFVVLTLILASCHKQTNDQPTPSDCPVVGSWKFIEVDSCFSYVIPNPEVTKSKLLAFDGSINFFDDGTGKVTSSLILYCDYISFTWQYKKNILMINSKVLAFDAKIEFKDKDTVSFKLECCLPRRGVTVWYEIISAKD